MEPSIRRDFAEQMGCKIVPRDPDRYFAVKGVSPELMTVTEDAIVKVKVSQARKILAWPSNPQDEDSLITLEDQQRDLYYEWRVAVMEKESSITFLQGGNILRDLDMKHHHKQQLISLRHRSGCFAIPLLSWAKAMSEVRTCGDPVVVKAHARELEECDNLEEHLGTSKAFVLRGEGSIPIKVGRETRRKLKGWVRVEAKSYPDDGLPILFEPTLCDVDRLSLDAYSTSKGDIVLPDRSIVVQITPVVKSVMVLDGGVLQSTEGESR
jgi:hypothetical protein